MFRISLMCSIFDEVNGFIAFPNASQIFIAQRVGGLQPL